MPVRQVDPVKEAAMFFFAMVPVLAPVVTMAYPCSSMSSLHREGVLERYPMLHTGYSNITTSFQSLSL